MREREKIWFRNYFLKCISYNSTGSTYSTGNTGSTDSKTDCTGSTYSTSSTDNTGSKGNIDSTSNQVKSNNCLRTIFKKHSCIRSVS